MPLIRGLVINVQSVDANGDVVIDPSGDPVVNVVIADDKSTKPQYLADGNTSGSIASAGTFVLGDLTIYGYPYKTVTFTNAGLNAATIVWGISSGYLIFQIAGTTPDIDLTATNTNDDAFTDVPVQVIGVQGASSGQTLGAGHFILYRP